MMAGMDDKEDSEDLITTEAMSGLSKILSEIDESHIRAILINVSLRIRPCFEKVGIQQLMKEKIYPKFMYTFELVHFDIKKKRSKLRT